MTIDREILERRRFRSDAEYEAALRDVSKIDEIKKKVDFKRLNSVEVLYEELQTGQLSFETFIGQEFDDEVYETYLSLKEGGAKEENGTHLSALKSYQTQKRKNQNINQKEKTSKKISLEDFDEEMQERILAELKKKERRRNILLITAGTLALGCLIYFGIYQYMDMRTRRDSQELAASIKEDISFSPVVKPEDEKYYAQLTEDVEGTPEVLDKYEDLYNQNRSLIGWVKIADTIIDYPVMQTVNNEYYLDHNFHQEYDKNGSIFLDAACSVYPRSTNLILYGHHMKSGSMFGSLQNYQNESYYKDHKYITFDTIYYEGTYEVMYAFRDKVYAQEDINFKYYEFIDANSEEEFNSYMDEMSMMSYYDTGVTAKYGDCLLTLSTCDYQQDNGRFVVVARLVTE